MQPDQQPATAAVCSCGREGRRGPMHQHECPVFLRWSHRPTATAALRVGRLPRSTVAADRPKTSTFAMSSIIFLSVPTTVHTLKPLQRKGKRPTPFETMELSDRQTEGAMIPRKSAKRLCVLTEIVADSDSGQAYRWAAAIEPNFFGLLEDGGYIEIREEGRHPLGGPSRHVYATDAGRALLRRWSAP